MIGYLHPGYAESLTEFGTPRHLPRSGGWLLERVIPGTEQRDAMGCYPLFLCHDWSQLSADLADLSEELVSVALVADPFGDYDVSVLADCLDVVIPFKEHLVADLSQPLETFVSQNNRYWSRRALKQIAVELCSDPARYMDDWMRLYGTLIERHGITGIQAFSRDAFERQFRLPGFAMFRASHGGETVGLQTYFIHGDVGYGHLMAVSETGYRIRAAYALTWASFEHYSGRLRWIDLGGSAGTGGGESDGLMAFKRGWATDSRTAYFCGRILDTDRYAEIVKARVTNPTDYFPAYRKGEFG